jgi:hypothetical protein
MIRDRWLGKRSLDTSHISYNLQSSRKKSKENGEGVLFRKIRRIFLFASLEAPLGGLLRLDDASRCLGEGRVL